MEKGEVAKKKKKKKRGGKEPTLSNCAQKFCWATIYQYCLRTPASPIWKSLDLWEDTVLIDGLEIEEELMAQS